jgi:hypothetical protein
MAFPHPPIISLKTGQLYRVITLTPFIPLSLKGEGEDKRDKYHSYLK